jgi:hypothetical protein
MVVPGEKLAAVEVADALPAIGTRVNIVSRTKTKRR